MTDARFNPHDRRVHDALRDGKHPAIDAAQGRVRSFIYANWGSDEKRVHSALAALDELTLAALASPEPWHSLPSQPAQPDEEAGR